MCVWSLHVSVNVIHKTLDKDEQDPDVKQFGHTNKAGQT